MKYYETNIWLKADCRNPWMGFDSKVCKDPKYWCRLHQVWLSEADAVKHQCFCKPSYDLRDVKRCQCLEIKEYNPFLYINKGGRLVRR